MVSPGWLSALTSSSWENHGLPDLGSNTAAFLCCCYQFCETLAWSPVIFRCWREGRRVRKASLCSRTQDSRMELPHSGSTACHENHPTLAGLNERENVLVSVNKSSKSGLLQVRFDPADYRTSPRALLVLVSLSASTQYYLPLPTARSPPFMNANVSDIKSIYT